MSEQSKQTTVDDLKFLRGLMQDLTHEIAAPLTPLFGHLDLLELRSAESLSPMQQRCMRAMRRSLRRLSAINDSMLELARIERGHIPCEPTEVDPEPLLGEVCRRSAADAEAREISLSLVIEDDPPQKVWADWNLLLIALGHLVDNALRFSPSPGEIVLRQRSAEGRCILQVEDHGRGVPPEEYARLTEPFYRINDEQSYTETAGLGLSIVTLIASRNRGELTLAPAAPERPEAPGMRAAITVPFA